VEAPFPDELHLRGVPQRIVRLPGFELSRGVDDRPDVPRVLVQRLPGPRGKRLVAIVVGALRAQVESQLAPRDQLIQELLRVAPFPKTGVDLVHRQMAEMEIGREAAGGIALGFVPMFGVVRQPADEAVEREPAFSESPPGRGRRHRVIDRQARQIDGEFGGRPPLHDVDRERLQLRDTESLQRIGVRRRLQMGTQVLGEEPAEGECRRKDLLGRAKRLQAVGVDLLQADADDSGRRGDQLRKHEARKVVGDDDAGAPGERREQALPRVRRRFDVRIVECPSLLEVAGVHFHAVEDESMEAVARPAIVAVEGLEDDEGLPEFEGAVDGALEAVVPAGATRGDHPIEDVVAVGADRVVVAGLDAELGNHAGHDSGVIWRRP